MSSFEDFPILIIGAGRIGAALAFCLRRAGAGIVAITSRHAQKRNALAKKFHLPVRGDFLPLVPKARLIFLAVNDDAIPEVAQKLHRSGALKPGTFLAHLSGSLPSRILAGSGAVVFSLHPLSSFSVFRGNPSAFREVPLIFEGDEKAEHAARRIAGLLQARFVRINPEGKLLYHTAACMASNFLITLAALAAHLNEKAGLSKKEALSILLPLLESTLANLKDLGLPDSLTGPIERGDARTVQKHLEILGEKAAGLAPIYKMLGRETLKLARAKGLSPAKTRLIQKALKG